MQNLLWADTEISRASFQKQLFGNIFFALTFSFIIYASLTGIIYKFNGGTVLLGLVSFASWICILYVFACRWSDFVRRRSDLRIVGNSIIYKNALNFRIPLRKVNSITIKNVRGYFRIVILLNDGLEKVLDGSQFDLTGVNGEATIYGQRV